MLFIADSMRLGLTTLLSLLLLACGDSPSAPGDAGPRPDRPAMFSCALPASAPLTPSAMPGAAAGVPSAVITWDGTTCGVDSDDLHPDGVLIVADVMGFGGMLALPVGDWRVDEASSGLPIPVDTEITY